MRVSSFMTSVIVVLSLLATTVSAAPPAAPPAATQPATTQPATTQPATPAAWSSIISARDLMRRGFDPNLLIIDVRPEAEYRAGHIPGAINLPGDAWRTASVKPGQGDSQYLFRRADGTVDIQRYEKILGDAGVRPDHAVVVYGSHGGQSTGSVPAWILVGLGHKDVVFLDGMGFDQWKMADGAVSTTSRTLAPATYRAEPMEQFVWNLKDVLANLHNPNVLFYDTRSTSEFTGADTRRGNKRTGRIPGAVHCDYTEFLTSETRETLTPEQVRAKLAERGITPDKKIVLYCQTATRTSHPYLVLRDLGFTDIVVYDASWHEFGNRDDTPVEADPQPQK